jgi:hypothetical protein
MLGPRSLIAQDVRVQVRPISMPLLLDEVARGLVERRGRIRVAIDGAEALEPGTFGAVLATGLRDRGRFALHISADDFLLPASQRFEFGKTSPESFYLGWRDERGLQREVLDPAGPDGSGKVLPVLWRADVDRSARASYVTVPDDAIVIVSGQFLLGGGLTFEMSVHVDASEKALARRTAPDRAWTLPAYRQYADEVAPATFADLLIRLEDPKHPAIVDGGPAA